MEYIGKFISNFRELYNGINAATLTGAIDVIIVQQEDGTFLSSPFHVRFGKLGVLRSREKIVDIEINGEPVDIHMKLGESGEAFFVAETPSSETGDMPPHLATSPIPTSFMNESLRTSANDSQESMGSSANLDNTLMGSRDEGLLASSVEDDLVIGSDSSDGTLLQVELDMDVTLKAGATDAEADGVPMPECSMHNMTEEERKRWKKKARKRRSQMRRKMQREASKVSSESGTEASVSECFNVVGDSSTDDATDGLPAVDETEQVKRGHRKALSLGNIDVKDEHHVTVSSGTDWTHNGIISRSMGPEFHFFSDTEMEIRSPDGSRPASPVHSDTEYEVGASAERQKSEDQGANCPHQSWPWGELPSPPVPSNRASPPKPVGGSAGGDASSHAAGSADKAGSTPGTESSADSAGRSAQTPDDDDQRSMLSYMLGFMRQTKKIRNQAGGGIYLDELNLDAHPELAALYINQSSFRQGLQASAASRLRDEDTESGKGASLPQSPHSMSSGTVARGPRSVDSDFEDGRHDYRALPDVALSLCGHIGDQMDPPEELFQQSLVTYDDFVENPRLIENPDLLVRIGSKYYTWQAACPIVMSLVLYQRFLPQTAVDLIVQEYMPKRVEKKEVEPAQGRSWFSWGRKNPPKKSTSESAAAAPSASVAASTQTETVAAAQQPLAGTAAETAPITIEIAQQAMPPAEPGTSSDNESNDSNPLDSSRRLPLERRSYYENRNVYCRTLRLTSEQIKTLNLREGPNEVMFSVTTAYQGTSRCKCHIYLWSYDDKVVISDIDGTITKSDVLGHILPIVGKDWAQSGVAQLFTKIRDNGYRILYLSARAIGQAHITREYLRSVRQGDLSLPDGPLLLNPTSLLSAFHREVIEKKPEEFKISCLRDIQSLFPSNPFYAGYGNRVNDVFAYRTVGIPTSRIFTINPRGELKLELAQTLKSSYDNQSDHVDLVFPPYVRGTQKDAVNPDYNDFGFWRPPLSDSPIQVEAATFLAAYADSSSSRKRRPSPGDKK